MEDNTNCMRLAMPTIKNHKSAWAIHTPRIFKRCGYLVGNITKSNNIIEYSRHYTLDQAIEAIATDRPWLHVFTLCYAGDAPYVGASNRVPHNWTYTYDKCLALLTK